MNKTRTTFEEFNSMARTQPTVPVYQQVLADLLTPISVFIRLADDSRHAFILESVEKASQYSRYSYIGANPSMILTHKNDETQIEHRNKTEISEKPFLEILRDIQSQYHMERIPGMPSFTGGLVGYLGYETITWIEDIPIHKADDEVIPDAVFMLFEELIAFDHLKGTALVFANVHVNPDLNLREQYHEAHKRIDCLGEKLHKDIDYQTPVRTQGKSLVSNFNKNDFTDAVLKAKSHIVNGDIFQLVLSQRFERKTDVEPITLYRALRTINPSPYMFHLKFHNFDLIGASPELLVKVADNTVEVRPIAGTRPRGKDPTEDAQLAHELLQDEKELAEHLMLLDLGRNDVGRVCSFGTLTVPEKMIIENYSHVMHIVSDVKGQLTPENDLFEALFSGFPAGTVTGAPKIRAMEIIYDLEPNRRGIYAGAVGYFDFCGNLNTCIAIRTMMMKNSTVYFQSGAGIVHDSDPTKEFDETVNKAKAIMASIDFAEQGLVE